MTTLEIMVGKKDFLTAQEVLSRIHFKDNILVSQNRRAAVYRILIEEDRMASVIQELRQSIKSLKASRLCNPQDGLFSSRVV